jgi:hypothetical protein
MIHKPVHWHLTTKLILAAVTVLLVFSAVLVSGGEAGERSLRVELPGQEQNAIKQSWPGIGCWFMTARDFAPDGYKEFVDLHAQHSAYELLTTSIRHHVEVTDPEVHDQIKRAAEYARAHGMRLVMDLDVRLARAAFMERYPDEMQEIVRLREIPLSSSNTVEFDIPSVTFADHYTPTMWGVRPYETLSSRLLRAYSYSTNGGGIEVDSVRDITGRCVVIDAGTNGLRVSVRCEEPDAGRIACVMGAFTLFTPDVFAPHLVEFERNILIQYADVPLAGACKDEWGFPGRFQPRLDDFYFSRAMARDYERRRPGRDLVRDLLLMFRPHDTRDVERVSAINHYMEMNWQRNAVVENAFYSSIREVFGPEAMSATHPTWYPDPGTREEVFKNGLHWWASRRDVAQTDESTPFAARTALAKKWNSPVWVNMYYHHTLAAYHEDLWRHVLGGGRMNFHPVYPSPAEAKPNHLTTSLLSGPLLAADARIRLLNFISTAPVDCPVAVVFGHPAALNWVGPGLADVGMKVVNQLWAEGYYADLIPSSEIAAGNLKLAPDGAIAYGQQRYSAVVLYHPEFERPIVPQFFQRAAQANKTALFRVGEWTRDFEGTPFPSAEQLPATMKRLEADSAAKAVMEVLRARGVAVQTRGTWRELGFPGSIMPSPSGRCRLLDGTVILASGKGDVRGDPIAQTIELSRQPITFDAIGIAAVRLSGDGRVEAVAAGGLKKFSGPSLGFELSERADLALWRDANQAWRGVLQGCAGPIPETLTSITTNWTRLRLPKPM